jgi:hypothetical protein
MPVVGDGLFFIKSKLRGMKFAVVNLNRFSHANSWDCFI